MTIHPNTRLTPHQRRGVWRDHTQQQLPVAELVVKYRVSRPTIYKILKRARLQETIPRRSVNTRFRSLQYGLKRLAKAEQQLEKCLKRESKRYNKNYPGELVHFDTKRLPLLPGRNRR